MDINSLLNSHALAISFYILKFTFSTYYRLKHDEANIFDRVLLVVEHLLPAYGAVLVSVLTSCILEVKYQPVLSILFQIDRKKSKELEVIKSELRNALAEISDLKSTVRKVIPHIFKTTHDSNVL